MQALTHDELLALLRAARAYRERDFLMILVGYSHALRASEVVGLTADSFRDETLDVQRLKGSKRTQQTLLSNPEPLLDERTAFADYFRNQWRGLGNQPIFGVTAKHYWRIFRRHAAAAGIPHYKRHPHVLKHTMLSQLAAIVPLNVVQAWGGHESLGSTGIYTGVSSAQASALVGKALSTLHSD